MDKLDPTKQYANGVASVGQRATRIRGKEMEIFPKYDCVEEKKRFPRQIGEVLNEILLGDLLFVIGYRAFKSGEIKRKEVRNGK